MASQKILYGGRHTVPEKIQQWTLTQRWQWRAWEIIIGSPCWRMWRASRSKKALLSTIVHGILLANNEERCSRFCQEVQNMPNACYPQSQTCGSLSRHEDSMAISYLGAGPYRPYSFGSKRVHMDNHGDIIFYQMGRGHTYEKSN